MSYLDINSNDWYTSQFNSFDDLKTQLYKVSPKEVILEKKLFSNIEIKEVLEKKY
jgi:DNA mismatch repair ATPase MutS